MSGKLPGERRVALQVVGAVVLVVGLAGLLAARRLGLTDAPGVEVVDVTADFMWGRQFAFNPLGAIVLSLIGAAILASAATRSKAVAFGTAATAGAVAVVSFVQLGQPEQLFAARAGNVSLLVGVVITLLAIAMTPPVSGET